MSGTMKKSVCVMRAISHAGTELPATVYAYGKKPKMQYLNRDTKQALGGDLRGYFEAEVINGVYFLGRRLPDPERTW